MKTTFKLITTLFILSALAGCTTVAETIIDPQGRTERVQAQEKTKQADAFAQSQQWLAEGERARAQQADADARARAAEAEARAQQAQAEANSRAQQSMAEADKERSKAFTDLGNAIKEAGQNNTPIIIAIIVIGLIAGWSIWNSHQTTVAVAQSISTQSPQRLLPIPPAIQLIADQHGLIADHDGTRWVLKNEQGQIVQRQKLLTINQ